MACKIQTNIGPVIIATAYIPPRRPIIPRANFDELKTYNWPVFVLGDFNANHRQLGDRQTNDVGEQLAQLMEIDGWNHMGPDFKEFHNHQGSGTPDKVMGYQSNILNWRIQRGPKIGTDHTPIILTISTNSIIIRNKARYNYNLADWQLFQVQTMKWENVELDGKNTEEIDRVTRQLIQHTTETKTKQFLKQNTKHCYILKI